MADGEVVKKELSVAPPAMALMGSDFATCYALAGKLAIEAGKLIERFQLFKLLPTKGGVKKHYILEAWQAIATPLGITVEIVYVEEIKDGFRAKAEVFRADGVKIGGATGSCRRTEENWKDKSDNQIESMAETRAAAKALRLILQWIPRMADAKLPQNSTDAKPKKETVAAPPPAPAGSGPNPPAATSAKPEAKPEEKKTAPDEAATARQKLFAVISLIEKDKAKGKAIYKALTGLEKAHDLDVKGLTSLTSALYEVKNGIAAIIPFENGRSAIIRKTDNVVLFGTVPPKNVMPTSGPMPEKVAASEEPF
jgi:hypothetical protein